MDCNFKPVELKESTSAMIGVSNSIYRRFPRSITSSLNFCVTERRRTSRIVKIKRSYLFEALVNFLQYSLLVEHFASKPMFIVVGDLLSEVAMQLPIRHILFYLLELQS